MTAVTLVQAIVCRKPESSHPDKSVSAHRRIHERSDCNDAADDGDDEGAFDSCMPDRRCTWTAASAKENQKYARPAN